MSFVWGEKASCGDTGPTTCEAKQTTKSGRALVVTDSATACDMDLVGNQYPSLAVSRSNSVTEQRSGSVSELIKLPLLAEQSGGAFPTIVTKRSDGSIIAWRPVAICNKQKMIVTPGGMISTELDVNSNIFEASCVGSIDDATHVSMSSAFTDCDGVTRYKQIFVDKETFLAELIASDLGSISFVDMTASGLMTANSLKVGANGTPITGIFVGSAVLTFGTTPNVMGAGEISTKSIAVPFASSNDAAFLGTQFNLGKGLFFKQPVVDVPGTGTAAAKVLVTVENVTAGSIPLANIGVRVIVFKY